MGYKITHRMPMDGNTIITIDGMPIKPIKKGDAINGGKSRFISVVMFSGLSDSSSGDQTSFLVSGNFTDDELNY